LAQLYLLKRIWLIYIISLIFINLILYGHPMLKLMQNKTFITVTAGMVALSILTSCETKQQTGGLIGGTTGALIGSQFGGSPGGRLLGAGLGAVVGAFAGSAIGKSLDDRDKARMQATQQQALERSRTGQTSTWHNPDSGNSGTVTTTRTFQQDGRYCREYNNTITVGGKTEKAYGTACRQPDGSWQVVS
jgi:surface antigen